jgi:hypothetical protein
MVRLSVRKPIVSWRELRGEIRAHAGREDIFLSGLSLWVCRYRWSIISSLKPVEGSKSCDVEVWSIIVRCKVNPSA